MKELANHEIVNSKGQSVCRIDDHLRGKPKRIHIIASSNATTLEIAKLDPHLHVSIGLLYITGIQDLEVNAYEYQAFSHHSEMPCKGLRGPEQEAHGYWVSPFPS